MQIPDRFKPLYSAEAINTRIAELGNEILEWAGAQAQSTGQDVIGIPILRGGLFFYADLMRAIDCSVEMAPVRTWGYDTASKSLKDSMGMSLEGVNPEGRSLLLVDDICDSGRTMSQLKQEFLDRGAAEVRSAVLVRRQLEDTFKPDYVAFHFTSHEWLVGYGMEDNDQYRNLPDVYTIEGTGQ